MRTPARLFAITAIASLWGCEALNMKSEPLPMQVQAYQTREFETDKTLAMSSVISVFQDLGYIIQSADKDVGFITATSPTRGQQRGFLQLLLSQGALSSTSQTRATAVLEEMRPGFTNVRLNFVVNSRSSGKDGVSERDEAVTNAEPYQVAFDKIEDAIFTRARSRTAPAAATTPSPSAPTAAK
jgi:hypothetical protein